jgi:hypothetical protein
LLTRFIIANKLGSIGDSKTFAQMLKSELPESTRYLIVTSSV